MNNHLAVAQEAARTAGQILRDLFRGPREVRMKGFRDPVTDADFAAHHAIRQILSSHFPAHTIRSEEDEHALDPGEWHWIVDPIDGTMNYARQYPVFSISIALVRDTALEVGVIYDPLRDEMYSAERGQGATLNGERIRVSAVDKLSGAVIGAEFPRKPALRAKSLAYFTQLASQAITARVGGSAALSFAYVAAGRLDAYYHYTLSAWDVAAGLLILEEAGGRATDHFGRPVTVYSEQFLATNGRLHEALLGILGGGTLTAPPSQPK